MDIRFWIRRYLDEGWSPIPIPAGEKGPRATGWEQADFPIVAFEDGMNVGVHLGKTGLYDVDLDAKEAAIAADMLLPPTNRISGRAGKPRSHRFYGAPHEPIEHVAYYGVGGAADTIVELRGFSKNGSPTQTVIPPSVHPSGESIEWDQDGEPFLCDTPAKVLLLKRGVRYVAVAVVLARAFPGPGNHHVPRLAMAGWLFRAGVAPADILQIGIAVMKIIGGDVDDWRLTARDTIAKLEADPNAPITGGKTLAEFIGDDAMKSLNKILDIKPKSDQRTIEFITADTIDPEHTQWIWDDWMPRGFVGLLAGREGLGKSLQTTWEAAKLTKGTLPGVFYGQPRSVIICATEDSWAHVIVPRLMAAGADRSKVIKAIARTVDGSELDLLLPVDLPSLREKILARGDVAMMYLDPLLSRLSGKLDTHKDAEVRRALEPLGRIAKETGISVKGLVHVNKTTGTDPLNLIMGSRAFSAFARFVHFAMEDPRDSGNRLFGLVKCNYGRPNHETWTFTVDEVSVTHCQERFDVGRLVWGPLDDRSISEALQEASAMRAKHGASGAAMTWLKDYMTQQGGVVLAAQVLAEGKTAGHSSSTLHRVRKVLGIDNQSVGFPATWFWCSPGKTANLTQLAGIGKP